MHSFCNNPFNWYLVHSSGNWLIIGLFLPVFLTSFTSTWYCEMGKQIHMLLYYLSCATNCCCHFALQPAIGIVLGFMGTKMIFDFFGEQLESTLSNSYIHCIFTLCFYVSISSKHWHCWFVAGYHIPTEASLAIVTTCLSGGVILSLRKASTEEQDK